ncbi:MAG: hypothetical protein NWE87_06650 [Candidatus Bathyarchaeota archaeon]|nr:hypothetical protein [Candidatus Bathyarchaeota archaeon]
MEKLKLNSKRGYNRSRVIHGHGPHRILEMKRKEMLDKIAKEETTEQR